MIPVTILINGQPIFTRSAIRVEMQDGVGRYKSDDGRIIRHKYDDGAVSLAQKLLKTIKEPKHDEPEAAPAVNAAGVGVRAGMDAEITALARVHGGVA